MPVCLKEIVYDTDENEGDYILKLLRLYTLLYQYLHYNVFKRAKILKFSNKSCMIFMYI